MDIEVNLRIPAVKEPVKDDNGYPINSADVRFIKVITVETLPKPPAVLLLGTRAGKALEAEVNKADWSESKERFIVLPVLEAVDSAGRIQRDSQRPRLGNA